MALLNVVGCRDILNDFLDGVVGAQNLRKVFQNQCGACVRSGSLTEYVNVDYYYLFF